MKGDTFYKELKDLTTQFTELSPELCETLPLPDHGCEGYIVVWNTGISENGPLPRCGKGGTRITPTVTLDDVKMLARTMALKNAAAGLPLGGAKSGLRADPDATGFEAAYRSFVNAAKPYLHENGGIFGGVGFDIGARPEHAQWACDELKSTRSFTGKPVNMGGTDYDREGIAGLGVATAAKTLLDIQAAPHNKGFAVQGAGAMGAAVIKYFCAEGYRLDGVSDPRLNGSWFFEYGAPDALVTSLADMDFDTARTILASGDFVHQNDPGAVLYTETDVLFPCAIQNVIHIENAGHIKARHIVEGANNPTTEQARYLLHQKGVTVIPDFLANPGGIIAAFVELTSTITAEENARTRGKVIEAKQQTIDRISMNIRRMMTIIDQTGAAPAEAGYYMAYSNIFNTKTV